MTIDDEVKKFLGVPPYDDYGNICKGDPIFYQSLCSIYGEKQVQEAIKIICMERNKHNEWRHI